MAEETGSTTKRNANEDLFLVIVGVLLVAQMLSRVPVLIEEKLGIDIGGTVQELGLGSASITSDTPLGTAVQAPLGADYYDAPGVDEPEGTFERGAAVALVGGPRPIGPVTWWEVRQEASGEQGWVRSSRLVLPGWGGVDESTPLGTSVRAAFGTDLATVAGGTLNASRVERGDEGALGDGPVLVDDARWWFFNPKGRDQGGWAPEGALTLATKETWTKGTRVAARSAADLFERPGGGQTMGYLAEDEGARIEGGAEALAGRFWWLVEADDGARGWVAEESLKRAGVVGGFQTAFFVFIIVASVFSLVLLGGLVYVTIRTNQIRAVEARRIREQIPRKVDTKRNERWEQVLANVGSENPNDWRLAIIEADIMLDEMLSKMGYHGETLGEKLKGVARGDMQSLDSAWEAHKVRNQIAHAGSDYILSQREARRIIELYSEAFREFRLI